MSYPSICRRKLRLSALLASSSALAALSPAFAQDETPEEMEDRLRLQEIVASGSPIDRPLGQTIIGASVLTQEDLARRIEPSIGETLRREPGVSSTFFGPGSSRPIIRGLGGARIRVLDADIGVFDASPTSVDHAVVTEPALAERVEVVRGTSMLRYGSSAAGGVVNVFDGRIPTEVPTDRVDGAFRYAFSSVNDGDDISGGATVHLGSLGSADLVVHGQGVFRRSDDYDIPGFAESAAQRAAEAAEGGEEEEDEEEAFGVVENSDIRTEGGAGGASLIFENGFIGFSGQVFDTNYGLPGAKKEEEEEGEEEEAEEGEEGVRIDLEQTRYDLRSEFEGDFGLFNVARLRVGYADYQHVELEAPGEVGTVFENEAWEGRLELAAKPVQLNGGSLTGAAGFQFRLREFSAAGEEAFVPPTDTTQFGFFLVEEYQRGPLLLDLGVRYERTTQESNPDAVGFPDQAFDRTFNGVSVSGGAGLNVSESVFAGVTAFRTERAPATEELFSNGPHLATNAFEIGDPNFGEEVAVGVEGTLRGGGDRFSFAFNAFYTSYDDFIFEAPTGEIEDGLPVFQFRAADAEFTGVEAQADLKVGQFDSEILGAVDVHLNGSLGFVRATTDTAGDNDLPRIPPFSGLIGVEANADRASFRAELEYAAAQDDIADFELPTDGYALVNTFVTLHPVQGEPGFSVEIAGLNLSNEEARQHASFLKDVLPLPGRNIRVAVRAAF